MEKLKEAIIKANQDIVKLKFGCLVFIQNFITSVVLIENRDGWCDIDGQIGDMVYVGWTGRGTQCFGKKHIKEIIGRPITLADVLIAINKQGWDEPGWNGLSMRPYYPESIQFESEGRIVAIWNLKEPLDNQSPETIEFLKKLLVK